ncbi:MAG: four helix bundle protein [Pyrinomonadaceae bacterium]
MIIWQKALEFAADIYKLTETVAMRTDFGLKDQLRRAAVSISANIAEGFGRRSRNEYLNFLNIAKGSSGEVRSLLEIAAKVGYISDDELFGLRERSKFLSGSITNHMKSI